MKKEWVILFLGIFFVVSCFFVEEKEEERSVSKEVMNQEVRAIYISYIELNKYFHQKSREESVQITREIVENVKKAGFQWILLHTRAFSDSIYPSQIFLNAFSITRDEEEKLPFDLLQEFIDQAHHQGIEVHAWVNPYRIRNDDDVSTITENNPAYQWLDTNQVEVVSGKGIFYNPASPEVQALILSGIEEIIQNYDIDGIHFDDYFYPSKTIDLENYENYKKEGGTLSLDNYRLNNVNQLVKKTYELVHSSGKNIVFGIAPDGNVQNNYQENYADILTWLKKEGGYVDYIMPQLYYGFQNQTKPFTQTAYDWASYIKNDDIQFLPALAFYKTGTIDHYARTGENEWVEHDNIILRQIQMVRNMKNYAGFSLFRYDSFFAPGNDVSIRERENFLKNFQK